MRTRRDFLISLAGGCIAAAGLSQDLAAASGDRTPRRLMFHHTHTGQNFETQYFRDGDYLAEELLRVENFMRDFRTREAHPIERTLLDQLHLLARRTKPDGVFEVISAYRSPETNATLHEKSNGVAKQSLHMVGKAIDVRLNGVATRDLRDAALNLRAGGVGYYADSDFVHLDTGRVRSW
jgi:uncharacterized protein YcbK (DUF882 family)